MHLSKLAEHIECKKIYNLKKNETFNFITTNSKYSKKKSILAIEKKNKFRKEYIHEAIKNGATAIITSYYYKDINKTQFLVPNVKKSIYKILLKIKKFPPSNSIAITGTNGKTSVLWFLNQIAFFSGKKTNTYGTLGHFKNLKKIEDSKLTTPEYEILFQKSFSRNKKNISEFFFEASSHSISKKRIKNFPINVAALTNISQDHLDFHKTLSNYKKTKFKLFLEYLKIGGTAILNDEVSGIDKLKNKLKSKKIKIISYGLPKSDIYINNKFCLKILKKKYPLKIYNYNVFEVKNLTCAIACCLSINIEIKKILKVLNKIQKAPGRVQEIFNKKKNGKIIIDYAHTPDALKNIILVNSHFHKKPNILFGCGGDRDKSKRKKMGIIANKYANKIYVTDDNPRNECPKKIRKEILKFCPKGIDVPGRRSAIKKAINDLDNEILIIAGKGHEKKQIINNKKLSFDDFKIAKYYYNLKK